jgi:hypothetical protein
VNALPKMHPNAAGELEAAEPLLLPIMAPRLQATCAPDGWIDVALWGAGKLGRVRFQPLQGPLVYGPNRIAAGRDGVFAAQSAPVVLIRGTRLAGVYPAKRCAWWHKVREGAKPDISVDDDRRTVTLGWGVIKIAVEGSDLRIAVGASAQEAERGLALAPDAIIAEALQHHARCDLMPEADPLLRSMVLQGVHAALSSIRQNADGTFGGLAAGQDYSAPARTYFRDGYWTMQPLLKLAPDAVREQIRVLASGIQPDGEAPSGVLLTGPAQSAAWNEYRAQPVQERRFPHHHNRPQDWWSDHFDSPLFFILALGDYVRATGDRAEAQRHWPLVTAIIARYRAFAGPDSVLPLKPRNDRDWADNVFREGLVAYDLGLFVGALDVVAELGADHDAALAEICCDIATRARAEIEQRLYVAARRGYADYATPDGFVEDHLTLDSLTLSRFAAISDERARGLIAAIAANLETRHNTAQPYGDWGVMCVYPPFKRPRDLRAKTAFAYRYHNGSDWPYWDGVYAEERLRRGLGGARYALTRWWQACLANGWAGAIEYFSPPFGRGSLLQGWSAMPAAAALKYGCAAVNAEAVS